LVSVRYFAPSAPLEGLVSSYYWVDADIPVLRDTLRAELAQMRFMVSGRGRYTFADGHATDNPDAMLMGPTMGPVSFEAVGPMRVFGIGLMPAGWALLVGDHADRFADDVTDLRLVLPGAADLLEQLVLARDDAARVAAADAFLLAVLARSRPTQLWFTRLADAWLTESPNPQVDDLIAASGMSGRSVERLAARLYGAPPKALARKYRALQAAVRIGRGEARGLPDFADGLFYDQAHFIREIKAFVGMTPGELRGGAAPIRQATLLRAQQLPNLPKLARFS
jgi:AraC-like DNA-binding protein